MLNLTKHEKQALLFLSALTLLGTAVNTALKTIAPTVPIAVLNNHTGKINLNTADQEKLMLLPGIGKKLAGRIMNYRTAHGRFKDCSELNNIKGISPAVYSRIKDMLFVQ